MRLKVNNEIVIDYHLKFMKMENHLNFNLPFVIIKLNHSFCSIEIATNPTQPNPTKPKRTKPNRCSSNGSSCLSLLFLIQFYHSASTATKWNPTTLIFVHTRRKFPIQLCGKNKITTVSTALTRTTTTTTKWNMVEFDEWTNNQHERFVYKQKERKEKKRERNSQKLRTLAQKYLTRVER